MSGELDIQGLQEAIALVETDIRPAIRAAAMAIAAEAQDRIAPYPSARRKKQAGQWSAKQRRAFFAKLRSGAIRVPYPRSGDTLARWRIEPTSDGVRLTNTSPHARWVHSDDQAAYHQGNWKTTQAITDQLNSDGTPARMVEAQLRLAFKEST